MRHPLDTEYPLGRLTFSERRRPLGGLIIGGQLQGWPGWHRNADGIEAYIVPSLTHFEGSHPVEVIALWPDGFDAVSFGCAADAVFFLEQAGYVRGGNHIPEEVKRD